MWKCSICGTINAADEKLCMLCGEENIAARNVKRRITAFLLSCFSVRTYQNIYAAADDKASSEKEKIRPVKILRTITKAAFAAMAIVIIFLGIYPATANKNYEALIPEKQIENVKNNIASLPESKWMLINVKYNTIKSGWDHNFQRFVSNMDEARQTTSVKLNEVITDPDGSRTQLTDLLTRLLDYASAVPAKCSHYYDVAVKNIKQIIGG